MSTLEKSRRAREIAGLRAEVRRLSKTLQQAQMRLEELAGKSPRSDADFELTLWPELSVEEIRRRLSPQELRVLQCYIKLPNNKDVARQMGKKVQTVRNQLASIERKLGACGRGELIIKVLSAYFQKLVGSG